MFSGIIEKTGKVVRVDRRNDSSVLLVETGFQDLVLGESVAVNGVCLTAAEFGKPGEAVFFVSPETMERTSFQSLAPGSLVNLERALKLGDRLSGHIVQGHVDGVAYCRMIEERSEARYVEFEIPENLRRYTVEKGSITLDGVSLTVNTLRDSRISIMLIPHTWNHTRFSQMQTGDRLNVEVDVIAKYTERLCQPYNTPSKL